METVGVPTYDELVIVARRQDLTRHGGARVRRFMRALAQGMKALRRDPESGIAPLLRANHDLNRRLQEASVKATMPVFFPADGKQPWGWQDRADWDRYAAWMKQHGLLKGEPNGGAALTTEFLPGQQLDPGPAGLGEAPGQG